MEILEFRRVLKVRQACEEAQDWVESGKFKTDQAVWDGVDRIDWMFWVLERSEVDERALVHLALDFSILVERRVPAKDRSASIHARKLARAWADGKDVPSDELLSAAKAAEEEARARARARAWASARTRTRAWASASAWAWASASASAWAWAWASVSASVSARAWAWPAGARMIRKRFPQVPQLKVGS